MRKVITNHRFNSPTTLKLKSLAGVLAITAALISVSASAAEESEGALLGRLKDSKHSLADGIKQSEKENGAAISAKFEMKEETLMLSVYTARVGLAKDAEHNELIELQGDAAKDKWAPAIEVFEDKNHLTRSAMHLTLVQVSKLTLADTIKKAEAAQPGTVYSVIPAVKDGAAVYDVKVATAEGKSVHVTIDGKTGQANKTGGK
jgi:uncharacterized membrane protein YkoI